MILQSTVKKGNNKIHEQNTNDEFLLFFNFTVSAASPLIRSMLNVNPDHRADILSICSHWWVDQTYSESCLDIAEDLANQTPVRLDLLLSLVPSVSSEKLVIGDIQVF